MTFEYNMYAKEPTQMTTLTIKSSQAAGAKTLLTLNGPEEAKKFSDSRDTWLEKTVSIPAGATSVTVHGAKGSSWQGDAAVDNIKFEGCAAAPTTGQSSSSDDETVKVSVSLTPEGLRPMVGIHPFIHHR
jgi:hypothetical protein